VRYNGVVSYVRSLLSSGLYISISLMQAHFGYLAYSGTEVEVSRGQIGKAIFGIHAALCTIHVGDCLSDMQ
jgi:hypothetical protein